MVNKHIALPIVSGLIIASLVILAGYLFVNSTHSRVQTTRNTIAKTHNQVAQLPQPEDIDLGVPSGSIAGQLENYRRISDEYKNLSFNAPTSARVKTASWMTFSPPPSPPTKPEKLAGEYKGFVALQLELLAILEKPLVYNPRVDLQNSSPESDEFLQRAVNANEGLRAAQQKIENTQLKPEVKEAISDELQSLVEANETLRETRDLADWSDSVISSQQAIRNALQDHWVTRIKSLTQNKQRLVEYYADLYQ